MQYVASQTKHKTMRDLLGIDWELTLHDARTMTPLDRARLSALHSGAFISNSEHAKFDKSKMPICSLCQEEDDRAHWLVCPRFQSLRLSIPGWLNDNVELPACTIYHLLVPRLLQLEQWKDKLCSIPCNLQSFCVAPPNSGLHHLFLDGTCTMEHHRCLQLASWGVVNATMGLVIAAEHLSGLIQSIDRAGLSALVFALQWGTQTDVELCIWSDSQSTANLASYIQENDHIPDGVENYDLWCCVQRALQDRASTRTHIRWIPSHMQLALAEDAFEDWIFHWNDMVDRLVAWVNADRPPSFWDHLQRLRGSLDSWNTRLRQLRQFYFAVAENKEHLDDTSRDHERVVSADEGEEWLDIPYEDNLPVNWQVRCMHERAPVPGAFLVNIINWLCAVERLPGQVRDLSDVEFVFALVLDVEFSFPFQLDGTLDFQMRAPCCALYNWPWTT